MCSGQSFRSRTLIKWDSHTFLFAQGHCSRRDETACCGDKEKCNFKMQESKAEDEKKAIKNNLKFYRINVGLQYLRFSYFFLCLHVCQVIFGTRDSVLICEHTECPVAWCLVECVSFEALFVSKYTIPRSFSCFFPGDCLEITDRTSKDGLAWRCMTLLTQICVKKMSLPVILCLHASVLVLRLWPFLCFLPW